MRHIGDRHWAAPLLLEGDRVSILALQALLFLQINVLTFATTNRASPSDHEASEKAECMIQTVQPDAT